MVNVVLVDKSGKKLGELEKLKAHRNPGRLHKAISVVLFRRSDEGVEILLQKRAAIKPLWPLYWANTVCTHPLPDESDLDCSVRRLKEEMGIEMEKKNLRELYSFYYQADYNQTLSEHELDVVMVGEYGGNYKINDEEVSEAKWVEWNELIDDLERRPEIYVPWLKMILKEGQIGVLLGLYE